MSQDRLRSIPAFRHLLARAQLALVHRPLSNVLPLLLTLAIPSLAWAACGCTGITVTHTDKGTVGFCSNADINTKDPVNGFTECTKVARPYHQCGTNFRYDCPVGANTKATKGIMQRTGFLVDAQLTGTASQCKSGHALQLTIKGNKVSRPKVHNTPDQDVTIGALQAAIVHDRRNLVPERGEKTSSHQDKFGADSYTDPNATDSLIHQDANSIKWWDNTDQSKDDDAEHASWGYRYLSYVTGKDGGNSCACVFDIDVDWPSNGKATTNWSKDDKKSTNCTLTP